MTISTLEFLKLLQAIVPAETFLLIFFIFLVGIYISRSKDLRNVVKTRIITLLQTGLIAVDDHPLLYCRDKYRRNIEALVFQDVRRTKLLREIFLIILDGLIKWAKVQNSQFIASLYIKTDLNECLSKAILAYECEILKHLKSEFGIRDGLKIYEIVYLNNVKTYNKIMLDMVFFSIEQNSNSNLKPRFKMNSVFTTVLSMLDSTILNIEHTFKELNGNLTSILDNRNR